MLSVGAGTTQLERIGAFLQIEIPQIFLPVVFDGFTWRQHDVLVEAMGVSVFFKGRRSGRVPEPKARSPCIETNLVLLIVQQKYYPHVWHITERLPMPDVSDVAEIVHGEARVGMVSQAVSEVQRVVLDPDALRKDDQLQTGRLFEGFLCGWAGGVS